MAEQEISTPFSPMAFQSKGYEAHYVFSERMRITQYHCHDYYELYLHIHGGEHMGVDNRLYRLKANQLFILPPFCMHGLTCTGELRGYERCFLNIAPETLKALGYGQIDLDQFLRAHTARGRSVYQLSEADANRFASLLRELQCYQSEENNPLNRFRDYSLMASLFNTVCQALRQLEPLEGGEYTNSIIQEVLAYINSHYTQPIQIGELARQFGISASYLSHEFSRFTNRSVYDYILYRRVMLSRQRMIGDDSLNTIAYECGFNDYSNFLRAFTKLVGISPSQYRKQLKRDQFLEM